MNLELAENNSQLLPICCPHAVQEGFVELHGPGIWHHFDIEFSHSWGSHCEIDVGDPEGPRQVVCIPAISRWVSECVKGGSLWFWLVPMMFSQVFPGCNGNTMNYHQTRASFPLKSVGAVFSSIFLLLCVDTNTDNTDVLCLHPPVSQSVLSSISWHECFAVTVNSDQRPARALQHRGWGSKTNCLWDLEGRLQWLQKQIYDLIDFRSSREGAF